MPLLFDEFSAFQPRNGFLWQRRRWLLLAFMVLGFFQCHAITVTNHTCEDRCQPLGIDVAQPRLGWTLQSSQRGDTQTAYQILVASSQALLNANTGDLWDSGMVVTNQLNLIRRCAVANFAASVLESPCLGCK
jgi:hypothetical protein